MHVDIVPDGKDGFLIEFKNRETGAIFQTVGGFATHEAAAIFVRRYLIELMVAMKPLH